MASFKSGFDPPSRLDQVSRSRRQATYVQPGSIKLGHREADIAHISGQMEPRRRQTPAGKEQQTGLPRPSMQKPSPASRSMPETKSRGFGFMRPSAKTTTVPELKEKSPRNVLTRKPSSIGQNSGNPYSAMESSGSPSPSKRSQTSAESKPSIDASLKVVEAYNEIFARPRAMPSSVKESPPIIPELDRYRVRLGLHVAPGNRSGVEVPYKLATDLPPPTPVLSVTQAYSGIISGHNRYSGYSASGYSASPSTRFSESPGPGAYSRDTTPTSMSSQSPGIIAPMKTTTPRLRQGSPVITRPPVTRRRAGSNTKETEGPASNPHGLPSLRESLTSSSSNSTVKGEGKAKENMEKKKKNRLSSLPPSPPPRKSSQKFKKPRPKEEDSPSKVSQAPAKPVMTAPSDSPVKPRNSPSHAHSKSTPPLRPVVKVLLIFKVGLVSRWQSYKAI